MGIGEWGREQISLFLVIESASNIPHCCRDQVEGGVSERSGSPLIHWMVIELDRYALLEATSAAPVSW